MVVVWLGAVVVWLGVVVEWLDGGVVFGWWSCSVVVVFWSCGGRVGWWWCRLRVVVPVNDDRSRRSPFGCHVADSSDVAPCSCEGMEQ